MQDAQPWRPVAGRILCALLATFCQVRSLHADGAAAAYLPEPAILGASDGLDSTVVADVAQDSQGFLWFASLDSGLLRYDGYGFRAYTHLPGNPRSISSNEVRRLYVDRDGELWIATGDGLNRYDREADDFVRIGAGPKGPAALGSQSIANLLVDRNGTLWVGTEAGLDRLDRGASHFRHYDSTRAAARQSLNSNLFWAAHEDSKGQLWFGTLGGGLLRYRSKTDDFEQFAWDGSPDNLAPASVRAIHMDRKGRLWIGCDEGLLRFDPSTRRFEALARDSTEDHLRYGLQGNRSFFGVDEDRSGRIWVSSVRSGAALWDDAAGRFVGWPPPERRPPGAATRVWKVFEDAGGTIWMVGTGLPVARFLPDQEAYELLGVPPSTLGPKIGRGNSLMSDWAGNLYLATSLGAHRYVPQTGTWQTLPTSSDGQASEAQTVYVDPQGDIWVSSFKQGELLHLDPGGRLQRAYAMPARATSLHKDPGGRLWGALPYFGAVRLDPASGELETFRPDPNDPASLSHVSAYRIFQDRSGTIWISTHDGLNRFDSSSGKFKVYRHDPADPGSLGSSATQAMCEDSDGRLWIGTGAGLSRYLPESDRFENHRLGATSAANFLEGSARCDLDGEGRLWIDGSAGIVRFDPRSGRVEIFRKDFGGPSIGAMTVSPEGVYLVGEDGLFRFVPEKVRRGTRPPPVAITGLSVKDVPVGPSTEPGSILPASVWTLPRVTLRHDQYPVTFEFAALDFGDPRSNQYAYRLEGVDRDWISSSSRTRQATYTTLSPGTYTLRVRAANKDGVWNEDGAALQVTVLPPWWRTWWAYLGYALASLLLLTLVVRWRTWLLRERAAQLERVVSERTQELQKQKATIEEQAQHLEELVETKEQLMTRISHEFRTPLTVILGPLERIGAGVGDSALRQYLDSTQRNASRLLRLVDQLLGLARLRAGRGEPTAAVHAAPIVRQVVASFESLAIDRGLELRADLLEDIVLQATADAIEKVCVNLVSNAIKYTPSGGKVQVGLALHDGLGCLSVADTGVGIETEDVQRIFEPFQRVLTEPERVPGSGLGLALVRELVTAQGGRVDVESALGRGSIFRASWPIAERGAERSEAESSGPSEEARLEVAALRAAPAIAPREVPAPVHEHSLLVVEDNPDMQRYLGELLGARHRCLVADDGEAGLRLAIEEVPDLVICDVLLPRKDGYEVCHEIKSNERTSHIPVIMLTALESRENRLRGLLERADDYLTKPFDEQELLQRVENLLEVRALLRERYARDIHFDAAPPADLNARDRGFLERLVRIVARRHADPALDVSQLASAVAMSERQLQRKLKALVNLTPAEYVRAYRLQQALDRLRSGERVGDVAMAVGFSSQAYFSTCFRARFGYPPNEARSRSSP